MENQTLEIRRSEDFQAEFAGLPIEARSVLDGQDYQRRVYDVSPNLSVTFRGRDELPTVGSSEFSDGRPSVVLTPDELPHVVDQDEFSEYVSTHPDTDSENKNLIVNATPVGIIDLVHRLSGDETMSSERTEMRANFLTGKVGDKENAVLDMMATAFVDIERGDPLAVSDGLMDVALALAGDNEKRKLIHEKARNLAEQEHGLVAKELGEDALVLAYEHEPIDPSVIEKTKSLVLVRTTSNEPIINEDGTVEMVPAATITRDFKGSNREGKEENFIPRQTTHFSLNHFVKSHHEGNFDNQRYVVVAPLSAALEAGQRPTNLYGVDTFFTTGPSEAVKLPDAKIIESANDQAELVIDEGIHRRYKTKGYALEDLSKVVEECDDGIFRSTGLSKYNIKYKVLEAARISLVLTGDGKLKSTDSDGQEVIGHVLSETEAEKLNYDEIVNRIAELNSKALDGFMSELVKNLLVDATIVEQGGYVVSGSNRFVDTSGFDNKVREIAEEIHSKSETHDGTHENMVEDYSVKKLHSYRLVNSEGNFDWRDSSELTGQYLNDLISSHETSHRLRRAAVEGGLSTVRGERDKADRESDRFRESGVIV